MKEYVKPDLYYENFELSQHIATCAWDMSNLKDKNTCSAEADPDFHGQGGYSIFTNKNVCDVNEKDAEDYCWTNGGEGMNVFNS